MCDHCIINHDNYVSVFSYNGELCIFIVIIFFSDGKKSSKFAPFLSDEYKECIYIYCNFFLLLNKHCD